MFDRRNVLKLAAASPLLLSQQVNASRHLHKRAAGPQPNFIHICADDMRFDDFTYMKYLRTRICSQATVFGSHFVPFSSCAPSRASMLTGQHVHNHGVLGNDEPYGYWRYREIEGDTLAVWLANAGYAVSHIGKFINGYREVGGSHIPPGYSDWHAFHAGGNYYDFTLNDNGQYVTYNAGEYSTDVFVQKALDFIATAPQPYTIFLHVACPHEPSTPATRDLGTFDNVDMPIPASFNEADMSDKPKPMQKLPLLTDAKIAAIQTCWRRRQETLQALDRGIGAIVNALTRNDQIGNTHILFTSDNGYLQGEHRVDDHKDLCYDEAVKVPLFWRQPGESQSFVTAPVLNMDATAAMVELAGATAGYPLDGRSLVPLLSGDTDDWNTAVLTECHKSSAVVTRHYRYVEWFNNQGIELYDMVHDRNQMQNVAGKPEYAQIQASLAEALHALQGCAGSNCSWTGKFKVPPALR